MDDTNELKYLFRKNLITSKIIKKFILVDYPIIQVKHGSINLCDQISVGNFFKHL